jgi:hypothetical protein
MTQNNLPMQREMVDSSLIKSIGYDEEIGVLQVEFTEGQIRDYKNVSAELYKQFLTASSKGRFYLKHIRKKFDFNQV